MFLFRPWRFMVGWDEKRENDVLWLKAYTAGGRLQWKELHGVTVSGSESVGIRTFPLDISPPLLFTWRRTFFLFHHHHPRIYNVPAQRSTINVYNIDSDRSVNLRNAGSASFQKKSLLHEFNELIKHSKMMKHKTRLCKTHIKDIYLTGRLNNLNYCIT